MSRTAKTVVIPWSRIEIDGVPGLPPEQLRAGAVWRWTGQAMTLGRQSDALRLERPLGMDELRARAGARAARTTGVPRAAQPAASPVEEPFDVVPRRGFVVTDGHRAYGASLAHSGRGEPLAIFDEEAPEPGTETWVVRSTVAPPDRPPGVICFTPGTRIRCEQGDVPAEMVEPGMRVVTADDGPQEVVWTGARRISGARLKAMPWMAPVRIREGVLGPRQKGDLVVSPRHKVLLRGPAARSLFGEEEVLVAAADLVDDVAVLRERTREVTYLHILCERHQLLWSGGVLSESFHPTPGALSTVEADQRAELMRLRPDLTDAAACGPAARRALGAGEAAILKAMF